MALASAESDSLDQLQSPEQIELLDAIDKLRNQGLGHYNISLPQLIVCGDQSSGKSSVLEGLTRLRFPTKDGLCTTFATELVLRKHAIVEIVCTIIPGKDRSQAERDELSKFKRIFCSCEDFTFTSVLDEAKKRMAFGTKSDRGPFFEDILQIRYSGPDLPSLTIVDLPGIIQSQIEGQKGVKTVRDLVQGYMADQRSIVLAVVSARNDLENQGVLDYVKKFDPSASRTLGIITKPDTLDLASESEARFIRLARNEIMPLSFGWHSVKNRGYGDGEQSDAERDESERQFFATGIWSSLSRANVGIEALRTRLSRVLLQHIRKELPSLSATIQSGITATEASLKGLGDPRDEQQQQRNFLMEKAQTFQARTLDALRGLYADEFFAVLSPNSIPPTRLRTQIQDLNLAFAYTMYRKGHQHHIVDSQTSPSSGCLSPSSSATHNYDSLPDPTIIDRAKFLDEQIRTQVWLSRQSGLTSIVNPWVVGEIFRQQAKPWGAIARQHLSDVYEAVLAYLYESLTDTMDTDTFNALMHEHIEPELERRQKRLDSKLDELLVPYQRQEPTMYDPSFINDLEQIRAKRYFEPRNQFAFGASQQSAPTQLLRDSADGFSNCEILDLVNTYYKKAISVFVSNVTVLAIENCLISDLPSLLSPELVLNMDDEKLQIIASESEETRTERAALKQKLHDLKAGKRVLDFQARRSGRVMRTNPQSRRAASNAAVATGDRPKTPLTQPASHKSDDPVESLACSFNSIGITPPKSPEIREKTQSRGAPFTPPKSPKQAAEPPPRWVMRADTLQESDEEE